MAEQKKSINLIINPFDQNIPENCGILYLS